MEYFESSDEFLKYILGKYVEYILLKSLLSIKWENYFFESVSHGILVQKLFSVFLLLWESLTLGCTIRNRLSVI